MTCRICTAPTREVLDLGTSPPANWLKVSPDDEEESYPLVLEWCETCDNVQLRDTLPAETLYRDYLYVTPSSPSLDAHYETLISYLSGAGLIGPHSFVVEAGSNAGHFLQRLQPRVARVLGVDPAETIAEMAVASGVPTVCDYFNPESAGEIAARNGSADLVVARHCLAHNETPHEMLDAATRVLTQDGHLLIENAYVLTTLENTEFDQIYHEHMFYFSVTSMRALLALHDLRLVDVMLSRVHGGSIVFVAGRGAAGPTSETVGHQLTRERPLFDTAAFAAFAQRTRTIRADLRGLVTDLRVRGATIDTYGATAKGNTLLNFAGLTNEHIRFCVDSTPLKQGRFLPRSNIKVISEKAGAGDPPDYYLLTAWNYADEIASKVRAGGNVTSRFIVPIPEVRIV